MDLFICLIGPVRDLVGTVELHTVRFGNLPALHRRKSRTHINDLGLFVFHLFHLLSISTFISKDLLVGGANVAERS